MKKYIIIVMAIIIISSCKDEENTISYYQCRKIQEDTHLGSTSIIIDTSILIRVEFNPLKSSCTVYDSISENEWNILSEVLDNRITGIYEDMHANGFFTQNMDSMYYYKSIKFTNNGYRSYSCVGRKI